MIELWVNVFLVTLLVIITFYIMRLRRLIGIVALSGAYSLTAAAIFVNMDAVDVAFTEAAVGSGISTILFLAALRYLPVEEAHETRYPVWSLFLCGIVGLMLIIAAFALPEFGDPNAPAHLHVAPRYIEESYPLFHIPNVVTNVLASYRGFDTLGETVVVFTAGLGVIILLTGSTLSMRSKQSATSSDNQTAKSDEETKDA
jgi:multicomponent Na+:H+ antiporter subunit B